MSTASTRPGRTAGTATCSWTASECTTMRPPVRDLTLLLAHTLTYSPSHPLTQAHLFTHSHAQPSRSPIQPLTLHTLTHSHTHRFTHSHAHPFTQSPIITFTHSTSHPSTHSPIHTLTPSHSHPFTLTHSFRYSSLLKRIFLGIRR